MKSANSVGPQRVRYYNFLDISLGGRLHGDDVSRRAEGIPSLGRFLRVIALRGEKNLGPLREMGLKVRSYI